MAETTAHTSVPAEGHKTSFPPFQRETYASQLVWLAISFAALYVLAARIALPRVSGIFAARRATIDGELDQARKRREESEATLAAYEKDLADARTRAQGIGSDTHSRLAAEADERRKTLETELNAKFAEADKAIAATKQAAMANVRGIAAEVTATIVERLIGSKPAEPAVAAAVDEALKR